MDPMLLRCFVAIARHEHLARAAVDIHLTKQALSYRLKDLEAEVGQSLFDRSSAGMRLTEAGKHLLPCARRTLDALDEFVSVSKGFHCGLSGQVDLGAIGDATWLRAPQVMEMLNRRHPEVAVRLHPVQSGDVPREVLEGRLTAGWMLGPVDQPGLSARSLASIRMRVVGPRAWSRQLARATLADLADFPWIDSPGRCAHHLHRQALFSQSDRQPVGRFQADCERTIPAIAVECMALGLVREDLALHGERAGELAIWGGAVPDLHLRFVLPILRRADPVGMALVGYALEAWKSRSSAVRDGG